VEITLLISRKDNQIFVIVIQLKVCRGEGIVSHAGHASHASPASPTRPARPARPARQLRGSSLSDERLIFHYNLFTLYH
jgi:hypothetical protein